MDTVPPTVEAGLYERDSLAWLEQQARALRERRLGDLDPDNLAEELEGMARAEQHELLHRLTTLLVHLIKLRVQPERHSTSWRGTILVQQDGIGDLLERSPSLRQHVPGAFVKAYERAIKYAANEMHLSPKAVRATVGATAPWSIDEVLEFDPPEVSGR